MAQFCSKNFVRRRRRSNSVTTKCHTINAIIFCRIYMLLVNHSAIFDCVSSLSGRRSSKHAWLPSMGTFWKALMNNITSIVKMQCWEYNAITLPCGIFSLVMNSADVWIIGKYGKYQINEATLFTCKVSVQITICLCLGYVCGWYKHVSKICHSLNYIQ